MYLFCIHSGLMLCDLSISGLRTFFACFWSFEEPWRRCWGPVAHVAMQPDRLAKTPSSSLPRKRETQKMLDYLRSSPVLIMSMHIAPTPPGSFAVCENENQRQPFSFPPDFIPTIMESSWGVRNRRTRKVLPSF